MEWITRKTFFVIIFVLLLSTGSIIAQERASDLVDLAACDSTIIIDLKYATADNFLGNTLYSDNICLLRRDVADRLVAVNRKLKSLGYRLKVWDGYRPLSVQRRMWAKLPNPGFVANPKYGSNHNRGAAVDVTLVDLFGHDVDMPTGFDDFSERARSNYPHVSREVFKNRKILQDAMREFGFTTINSEWWHFNDKDAKKYPVLDIPLKEFVK